MLKKTLSRRDFLRMGTITTAGLVAVACGGAPSAPPPAAEEEVPAAATAKPPAKEQVILEIGATGGGDCHEGHCGFSSEDPDGQGITPHTFASILLYRCGMTAAVMPGLDRGSLIQAIRNRRTYATTGARILLEFTAAGLPMGSIGTAAEVECCATVSRCSPAGHLKPHTA